MSSSDSVLSVSHEDEKKYVTTAAAVTELEVDVAAQLDSGSDETVSPEDAVRIRRRVDLHILPLMCLLYLMQFADKTTLGQSAVLGLLEDAHLTANQFNWLGTIFYLSYLVFEYPQNLALQRLPIGKWMSINIFVWSVSLCTHAACKSFGGLFAVRFIMGICEGAITAGFLLVTSMFYTRKEQTVRVGYWFLMNGAAIIFLGFVAFGVLHTKSTHVHPWQWMMIITGLVTFVTSILFWFLFPDSPANAWFLTPADRRLAALRIKENQTGMENKHFKIEQFWEAIYDPKTWLFALFAGIAQVPNSLSNQRQIIINLFGFTPIQTTLLGCVDGLVEIIAIFTAVKIAAAIPNSRSYVGFAWAIPGMIGDILLIALSSHRRVGLLFSYWTSIWAFACFPMALAWMGSVTAGHTKRITTNAIVLIFYAIGNASGPFMWKQQYKPRNRVPFAVILACEFSFGLLFLVIRAYLARENRRRDQEQHDQTYDDVYVTLKDEYGNEVQKKIDKAFLDLTDQQNREFRYVL
ncbi:MFS general substrate transporter [Schizopora paradoxa]|uniref:MFS general substrate transporter n=1 Tax=Schizopora paradoxa TaxID=27342 RepID=A0A0H2RLW9_9AGAM|nr:MFS general substrate transporter [Schizopora paradoxa]